ncbi:polysaccharide deacetylase family protein [Lederbergia panacisoli]|uniref:polysaccharide deacetylase family protein n=1 Tax=Lederbergia panacisoli TaxID=1255251 RepID=UPI00214C345E|nr:polysaccharide deacetylase family protein [Lederbergia panacisoli]MCR2822007.1 polysaccharide deacetylase family protein [Lederbergia panacisoli]
MFILKSLVKKYFEWRYWGTLYRNMADQVKRTNQFGKENNIRYINKPGIALSFDDSYRVYDWYKYGKPIFDNNDIKVTFNVNGVHPLKNNRIHIQEEIDLLLELQSDGHEIANHGFKHRKATDYSKINSVNKWIDDEIVLLNNWLSKQSHSKTGAKFKKPASFAFPHFLADEKTIAGIIPNHFNIARGHLNKDNLSSFNHFGFAPSICLDSYYSCNFFYLKKILKLVKRSGENLILTGHSILPQDIEGNKGEQHKRWGNWRVSPNTIEKIIKVSKRLGLEFYTTSEIAGVATFSDIYLESAVREKISLQAGKWLLIKDLINIKELDLSNKGIKNLDGIQYFLNVEKLDISNNAISDFSLLKKLQRLKHLNIANNYSEINAKVI